MHFPCFHSVIEVRDNEKLKYFQMFSQTSNRVSIKTSNSVSIKTSNSVCMENTGVSIGNGNCESFCS